MAGFTQPALIISAANDPSLTYIRAVIKAGLTTIATGFHLNSGVPELDALFSGGGTFSILRLGETELSLAALDRAVQRAIPSGVVGPFALHGRPLKELLHALRRRTSAPVLVDLLLAAFPGPQPAADTEAELGWLTDRELEALRLLPRGCRTRRSRNTLSSRPTQCAITQPTFLTSWKMQLSQQAGVSLPGVLLVGVVNGVGGAACCAMWWSGIPPRS